MIRAHLLQPSDVAYVWESVAPLISRVTRHTEGELEPDDFIEPLTHGEMQLWVVEDGGVSLHKDLASATIIASLITQIVSYPQKKVLRLISLAGDNFEDFKDFISMVEAFAVRCECSALEMWGRKGWKKLLPDWKDSYIVYTKDIKERMQ